MMFNKQLKRNIADLDKMVCKLYEDLNNTVDTDEKEKIRQEIKETIDFRDKLSEVKTREALAPIVIPGVVGISSILLVLHYEKKDIITSKAMSFVTKMVRGL